MTAAAAFICAGILFAVTMDMLIMPRLWGAGSEIKAPDLLGKTVEEAKTIARKRYCSIIADSTEYNYIYPAQTVAYQYPLPGTNIKPGRRVRLTVSLGPRPIEMRSVIGKPRRDAELDVKALGLKVAQQVWVHSNEYIRGIVARQFPEAGQMVPDTTEVVLYISDGLPETDLVMPNLINLSLSAAKDTLKARKFDLNKVNIQYEESPEFLPETVIDQHPDPGTQTHRRAVIDLVVSSPQ